VTASSSGASGVLWSGLGRGFLCRRVRTVPVADMLSRWNPDYGGYARHRDGGCGLRAIRVLCRVLLIGATLAFVAIVEKRILHRATVGCLS